MDPTACSCSLCVPKEGALKAEIEKQLDEKLVFTNAAMMSFFADPPQVPNNEAFADNDDVNPPTCPGCGGQMEPWSYGAPLGLKWQCHGSCYYCEHSEGCGFQDQSTYCQDCYGCKEHCTCGKHHCDDCGEEVKDSKWCEDSELCHDCCSCDSPSDSGDSSTYGKSKLPGWVERGITIELPPKNRDYELAWGFKPEEYDLVQEMASFYVKEYVVSNVQLIGVSQALMSEEVLDAIEQARSLFNAQIERLDPVLQSYIDMAVGGELRYHQAMRAVGLGKGNFSRESAWVNWRHVREQVGPEALLDAAKLAREVGSGGILGPAWAVPAEILHSRITGQIDARTFIDRAFSLQHNGGCLFNKVIWRTANRPGWDLQAIQFMIGPAHFANPIQWGPLLAAADAESVAVFNRYWKAANKVRASIGTLSIQVLPSWRDGLIIKGTVYRAKAGYPSEAMAAKGMPDFYAWNRNETLVDSEFAPTDKVIRDKEAIDELMKIDVASLPNKWSYSCSDPDCTCQVIIKLRDNVYRNYLKAQDRYGKGSTRTDLTLRDVLGANDTTEYITNLYHENNRILQSMKETISCPNKTKKMVETKGKFTIPDKPHPDATWQPGGAGGGGKWVMPIATNTSDLGVMWDEKVPLSTTVSYSTNTTLKW